MKIKNIDEEILIVVGVIIIGMFVVLGIIFQTFKFSDAVSIFSVVVAALALYYAKRVRGPEFNLAEARIDARKDTFARVKIVIQNIGDRVGYLRWDNINLKVNDDIYHIRELSEKEFDWQAQADTPTPKTFHFKVSLDIDLTGGIFLAKGVYSSHKGKMIKKTWRTPLTGMLKPIEGE